jgi:hypothetical protein
MKNMEKDKITDNDLSLQIKIQMIERCHFQSFHSILIASVQFKYKKIVTYEEFSPNMCIIYLFQHATF